MKRAIVLLSAGLDSTVNLLLARKEYEIPLVLTFDYGQRAAQREVENAGRICEKYGLKNEVVSLPWLGEISQSSLNKSASEIPGKNRVSIDDLKVSQETARAVWVPNRNGVFLNVAAAYAEAMGAQTIIPGFNREEAQTFPDNSADYLQASEKALSYSTQHPQVDIKCYTIEMDKLEIVRAGKELDAPFDLMWPCYFAGEKLCEECESCQRFLRAVKGQVQ